MIIDFFCYFFFNFTFFVGGVGVGGSEERVYFLF